MGPFLKFLLGLFLIVWTVIGIGLIAGTVAFATQLPKLQENLAGATQLLGTFAGPLGGNDNQNGNNQSPGGVNPQMQACAEKALGKSVLEKVKQGAQLTEPQRQAFDKCGFQPNTINPDNQAGQQQNLQPMATPPGQPQAGFPPKN